MKTNNEQLLERYEAYADEMVEREGGVTLEVNANLVRIGWAVHHDNMQWEADKRFIKAMMGEA